MSKYEWKQTIFTPEDFKGAGQYIVREHINKEFRPEFLDTGFLSTVLMKIGWTHNRDVIGNTYVLIDMSDGLIKSGYFVTKDEEGNKIEDSSKWKWNGFTNTQSICDYLNNNPHGETYRFATNEELIRVAAHQKWRTK